MPLARRALAVLLLAASASSAQAPAARDEVGSLEAFLRRVREARDAERGRLAPLVQELVERLGAARGPGEVKKIDAEIARLGAEAAPLLVPWLDPGANPTPEHEKRAQEVAAILARAKSVGLFDDLVRLARTGTTPGRLHALRVLGESPDAERAAAALRSLHAESSGELRAACVTALAKLAPADPLVLAALSDPNPAVLSAGLRALAAEPRKAPRPEVVALLADERRAADVLPDLVDYFCVPGQQLDEEIVVALVRFACRADLPLESRMKVMQGLPRFGVPLTSRLRREVEPLLESSESALKDGTLIALTLLKDSKARRDLMRFYDDQVEDNESWPLAYQRRADVELAIGEYRDAARDYERALTLLGDTARLPGNREVWINLARAHVKDGKLKAAVDALEEFTLSSELKRTLAADPDFQPLVEHSKYKALFE